VRFSLVVSISAFLALAACAKPKADLPAPPPPTPAPITKPTPPNGAPEGVVMPPRDESGAFRTINSGVNDAEATWHLRSALNVAALSCDRSGKLGIAAAYNALLDRQKGPFATAYRDEGKRFASSAALDRHVTQIYNFFAQPPAQSGFCRAALTVAIDAKLVAPDGFPAFATTALPRLEAPFLAFYRAYEQYRVDLAAWENGDHRMMAKAAPMIAAPPAPSGPPWRIQLGAYSGDRAARDAWAKISKRMDKVATFEPRYEPVPGKPLVRVQIGPVTDRDEAIALCAAAAAANLDCRPVQLR